MMLSSIKASINSVIALEIEEFDPTLTQIGDQFSEAASKLKPFQNYILMIKMSYTMIKMSYTIKF
jgi:hypothetical protein